MIKQPYIADLNPVTIIEMPSLTKVTLMTCYYPRWRSKKHRVAPYTVRRVVPDDNVYVIYHGFRTEVHCHPTVAAKLRADVAKWNKL